jgi:predicted DNA binding CopG/RHH family protein/predicted XRE-type DNA-binding protein
MLMSERHAIHDTRGSRSAEFEAAARLTHLRLELALAMQTLRASVGLTQKELADRLGVNQPAIAKLERVGDHKIESVVRYLGELGAELMVAVRHGDEFVQVSDDRERLLLALPREVDDWAAAAGMDLDAFVMLALREARAQRVGAIPVDVIDRARELASVASRDETEKLRAAARATGTKDRRVNIRLSSADVRDIQALALREGIPYQTLIASILHKYVTGRLVERG